jgi:hypothetical protein
MIDYEKLVQKIIKARNKGGDDFDIINRVSTQNSIPFSVVKNAYQATKVELIA